MKIICLDRHAIDEFHSLFNGGKKVIPDSVYLATAAFYNGTVHAFELRDFNNNLIEDVTDIIGDIHRMLILAFDGLVSNAPKKPRF